MADVLFEKRADGVGLITLNRPDSLNAMGGELLALLARFLDECEDDPGVRCVALTGAGRAFCAGGDVKAMAAEAASGRLDDGAGARVDRATRELRRFQDRIIVKLHTMPRPTVALVNGHAVGAGMSLALACDLRFSSDQARFGTGFRNVGLSGDYGGSYFLQRLVGAGRARELYFTAEVIDAGRALELGIANRVVPHADFMAQALEYCARLAAGPTAAYARMKENLNLAESSHLEAVLDQEAFYQRFGRLSVDFREAATAFVEKRQPRFEGR